jgi:hypothetical protein
MAEFLEQRVHVAPASVFGKLAEGAAVRETRDEPAISDPRNSARHSRGRFGGQATIGAFTRTP